jgi:hypothetical protein
VIANDVAAATERAKLRTVALALDANLSPVRKLELAPKIASSVRSDNPLASVRRNARAARSTVPTSERSAFDSLVGGIEDVFVVASAEAFRRAFLIAALLAFAAGGVLAPRGRLLPAAAFAAALAAVGAQALVHRYEAPKLVRLADPCQPRRHPQGGGFAGPAQDVALSALDKAACFLGSSREELVLALASSSEGERFKRRHGVNPRSIRGLIERFTQ